MSCPKITMEFEIKGSDGCKKYHIYVLSNGLLGLNIIVVNIILLK